MLSITRKIKVDLLSKIHLFIVVIILLQMKNSFFDLLSSALIPELCSDVSAGSACYIHLVLIAVSAVGAFPDELSVFIVNDLDLTVVSAYLTVIALGIKLCVHDVLIDVLHYGNNRIDVVLKVGHLNVADSSAG